MLLDLALFSAISYIVYQFYQQSGTQPDLKASRHLEIPESSMIREKIDEVLQDISPSVGIEQKHLKHITKNNTDLVVASVGLTTAFVGKIYPPSALLSIPCALYATRRSNKRTLKLTLKGKTDVDTMVSITIVGCLAFGYYAAASWFAIMSVLATRLLMKVVHDSSHHLIHDFGQQPNMVWKIIDTVEIQVPINSLQEGDHIVVNAGEMIPIDGLVVSGVAMIDQHVLTGESKPVQKQPDDVVFSSTLIISGQLHIQVQKTGQDTVVAKIIHILNNTVDFKSTTSLRAEKLGKKLVNPILLSSLVAMPIIGVNSALAIIAAHPKNKLIGIPPISILSYFNLASRQGILIKDGRSLELLTRVDTIIFDKTGTLTENSFCTSRIYCFADYDENDILAYAAAVERHQKHPLANAILQTAKERGIEVPDLQQCECRFGHGLIAQVEGKTVHVGSQQFILASKIDIPKLDLDITEHFNLVMVAIDEQLVGAIELQTLIRPEAKAVIQRLKQRPNIRSLYILSGDTELATRTMAEELGIKNYFAEVMPDRKAEIIEKLQQEGHFICYVGDGVNDSIALKKSQMSVSLRGASTIATDTAQVVLMDGGIDHLNTLFDLAEQFNKNMNTTLILTVIPSIVGVTGALFLHFGVLPIVILNTAGVVMGTLNAVSPLLRQNRATSIVRRH